MQVGRYFILSILQFVSITLGAQSILNGSFEFNDFITCSGTTNIDTFNLKMHYVKTFGNSANSLEVLKQDSCVTASFGFAPSSGIWMVGKASYGGSFEDFGLELSENLNTTQNYTLNLNYISPYSDSSRIFIGYSNTDSTFGDTLFISDMVIVDTLWDTIDFSFKPKKAYSYITVSSYSKSSSYFLFDNFILTPNTDGIDELKTKEISIYPNPFTNEIFIKTETTEIVKIVDVYGREVMNVEYPTPNEELRINTSHLASGVYIIDVGGFKQKLIKN